MAISGIYFLLAEDSSWIKYKQINLTTGTNLNQAATLRCRVGRTSFGRTCLLLLKQRESTTYPEIGLKWVDHFFLKKNLQKDPRWREKKIISTTWFSEG